MTRKLLLFLLTISLLSGVTPDIYGQSKGDNEKIKSRLSAFFLNYESDDDITAGQARLVKYSIDNRRKTVNITSNNAFAVQKFTKSKVKKIYKKIAKALPKPYNKYKIKVITDGISIEELVPDMRYSDSEMPNMWGKIEYDGAPWTSNVSKPNTITHGLSNRHISLWASHGMYFDQKKNRWKWQRPNLFGTTEDLFTQTIVVPYLIPMLENAGATVFTPRERDYQTNEIIIDNNNSKAPYYTEFDDRGPWADAPLKGFAYHNGTYNNSENPFEKGTARMAKATSKTKKVSAIAYQPDFPEAGRYAVYVSYQTIPSSVPDAEYIVYHKGQETKFRVNQTMGGSTWVYLGTFEFDKGCNPYNRVVVTNNSSEKGFVTADAVRFGGGMGNIMRGGTTSGMPRCLEGARYSAQWYGAPYSVYSGKNGNDDYSEDINARSLMTNWLAGGSVFLPSLTGKKVPIELSLAVHSDAGYTSLSDSIIGSLSICTTNFNGGRLNSGVSRMMSRDFADSLLTGITRDLRAKYKNWNRRFLFDRNYSETRVPEVPSSIIETLSHQNFADMRMGHDPNFKFTIARSIYKSILRFVSHQHGRPCIVQPLAPNNFRVEIIGNNKIRLSWTPVEDQLEPTAVPTSYNIYTSMNGSGFDNGTETKSTSHIIDVEPGMLYNFKVTAVNRGGESFPTEVLSAYCAPGAQKTVLVVNGFHRLSSPAVINNETQQGFDLDADPGVTAGLSTGWNGRQINFNKSAIGIEGPDGLGYCGNELAGRFFMGNEFNYVRTHADAISAASGYNVASCSSEAVETGVIDLKAYDCVDLLLGLEKNDGHSLVYYKTFTPTMQSKLSAYTAGGGRLLVSGAYIGQDMKDDSERRFLSKVLHLDYAASNTTQAENISGLGMNFDIYRVPCKQHYAATSADVLSPLSPAFCVMQYADGVSAAVAYDGTDYKCFSMGFPFECIKSQQQRRLIMKGILSFLMK